MKTLKKVCSNIYLVFIFVLLYAPIADSDGPFL